MTETTRCPNCHQPLRRLAEPPSAHGFEFSLDGCENCGFRVMRCFCVASGMSGDEPVTAEDAAIIENAKPDELKAFMKAWQEKAIG